LAQHPLNQTSIRHPADKVPAEDLVQQGEQMVENVRQPHRQPRAKFPPGCGSCEIRTFLRIDKTTIPNPVKVSPGVSAGVGVDFHGFPSTDYDCFVWF
jgi:hypothetical protein